MSIRHHNLSFAIACLLVVHSLISAQTHPAEAEENPLSTVIYLLSKTDKDDDEWGKACLARSLGRADRFDEISGAIDMVETSSVVEHDFVWVVQELITRGKDKEASTLLSYLIKRFGDDEYMLESLVKPMLLLKRDAELQSMIEKFDDSDKLDLWFKSAEVYTELGSSEKAFEVVKKTVSAAMASQYLTDRSELALRYAKLGRQSEATKLVESIAREMDPKAGNTEVIHDLADAYKALGKYSEANDLRRKYTSGLNIDETRDLIGTASRLIASGDRQKALDTLARALTQLDPKEYGDSFNLGDIIEIYLRIGEVQKAEQVAMSIAGSDYMQQGQLLAVVDRYAKAGNKRKARELLRFVLAQTYKIDTSEAESGTLSTSGKMEQARYQSQIALRYMDLRDDKEALRITARLRKPYLRALTLTEYVAINKHRMPARKLAPYLEEALGLLRQEKTDVFDSNRFDVYAIAARTFAEIGMTQRSNEVFVETLTKLDLFVIEERWAPTLIYAMCNIGVDFERAKIKADENVRAALRKIIENWEDDRY